jgi:peptidyl-tRNA hydrolase
MPLAAVSAAVAAQYHYCIVRKDAASWPAQLGHAAAESAAQAERTAPEWVRIGECNFVALAAKDEAELRKVEQQLVERGILFTRVVETDGPHAGQLMALGVLPRGHLPVLRWLPLIR